MTTKLYTETFGEGPAVVLLHGWAMNAQIWPKELLNSLPVKWILVDLPGHGKSSHIPLSEKLDDVLSQLNAVIPNQATIIGWSLGGMFALALSHLKKTRGCRLGIISSSPLFVQKKSWAAAMSSTTLEKFSDNLKSDAELTIKRFIALQFMNEANAKLKIAAIQNKILNDYVIDTKSLMVGLNYLKNLDLRSICSNLEHPTIGLYGRLDNLVPINALKNIENCFTEGQFSTMVSAKSGHAPFLNDPDLFLIFLQRVINIPTKHAEH